MKKVRFKKGINKIHFPVLLNFSQTKVIRDVYNDFGKHYKLGKNIKDITLQVSIRHGFSEIIIEK